MTEQRVSKHKPQRSKPAEAFLLSAGYCFPETIRGLYLYETVKMSKSGRNG